MPIVNPALNRRCLTYNGLINPSPKNLPCWLVGRASLCLCFMVLLWPKSIPFKMWLREHMRSVIYQRRFESLLRYLSLKMFLGICYAFIPVRRLSAYNLCHSIVPLKFNLLILPIKFNQLSLGEIFWGKFYTPCKWCKSGLFFKWIFWFKPLNTDWIYTFHSLWGKNADIFGQNVGFLAPAPHRKFFRDLNL